MMLTALRDYARTLNSSPVGYQKRTLDWVVEITDNGTGVNIISRAQPFIPPNKVNAIMRSSEEFIPGVTRTSAPAPQIGADTGEYVLGLNKNQQTLSEPVNSNSQKKHGLFITLLNTWAAQTTEPEAQIIQSWYANGKPGLQQELQKLTSAELNSLSTQWAALKVDTNPEWVHDFPSAQKFWAAHVSTKKIGATGMCICCGNPNIATVKNLPQGLPQKLVPGATQSTIPPISANFNSARRTNGPPEKERTTLTCLQCSIDIVDAIKDLATKPEHTWGKTYGDQPVTIWWVKNLNKKLLTPKVLFPTEDTPEPYLIKKFINQINNPTKKIAAQDSKRFYALTYHGNASRFVVDNWIDIPVESMQKNVAAWLEDTEANGPNAYYPKVTDLAASAGVLRFDAGRAIPDYPQKSVEQLTKTAITGTLPPWNLLIRALNRNQKEHHLLNSKDENIKRAARRRAHARASLIRLILNRHKLKGNPMPAKLDHNNTHPAYLMGRIFAIRERAQRLAQGSDLNTTVADRWFSKASVNPSSVENLSNNLTRKHLRKASKDPRTVGASIAIGKTITEIMSNIEIVPGRLSVEDQGKWELGYYHQQQYDWDQATKNRNQTSENDNTETVDAKPEPMTNQELIAEYEI